jgi:hypothetical protein
MFILFALSSCSNDEPIYYEYNGVTVTRIDGDGESYFYYGKCGNNNITCPDEYIKAEYYGFDGVMEAYLVFQEDKRVKLIRVADHFEKKGNDSSLFLFDYRAGYKLSIMLDSIKGNYDNVAKVFYAISTEKRVNTENNSNVVATYPINE